LKIRVRGTQKPINPASIVLKGKNCLGTRTGFWNGLSSDSKVSLYIILHKLSSYAIVSLNTTVIIVNKLYFFI